MKRIPFIKMEGAGNDFVFLTREKTKTRISRSFARRLLDRHFGIGGDQLLVLSDKKKNGRYQLAIYNSDGSEAETCGNGVRAVADYLRARKNLNRNFVIQTKAGPMGINLTKKSIEVDMGKPVLEGSCIPMRARGEVINRPLRVLGKKLYIHGVSMGNPHCVIFVKDVNRFPVREVGPAIEHNPLFPRRVNVEFVQILSSGRIRARVWERGAGETLACGTGACAMGVAAARYGKTRRNVKIDLPGGQLGVRWAPNGHVYLTGPTEVTFEGEFHYV